MKENYQIQETQFVKNESLCVASTLKYKKYFSSGLWNKIVFIVFDKMKTLQLAL